MAFAAFGLLPGAAGLARRCRCGRWTDTTRRTACSMRSASAPARNC